MLAGVRAAAPMLDAFIDDALAARGLDERDLALVGFSQGTMMSLYVGLRRARPLAGILGFSGRLSAPRLLAQEIRSRPPVLLVHGDADPVVPFASLAAAETALKAAGVPVETVDPPRPRPRHRRGGAEARRKIPQGRARRLIGGGDFSGFPVAARSARWPSCRPPDCTPSGTCRYGYAPECAAPDAPR